MDQPKAGLWAEVNVHNETQMGWIHTYRLRTHSRRGKTWVRIGPCLSQHDARHMNMPIVPGGQLWTGRGPAPTRSQPQSPEPAPDRALPPCDAPYRTTQEAAEQLELTIESVRRLITNGKLMAYKTSKSYRIPQRGINDYRAAQPPLPAHRAPFLTFTDAARRLGVSYRQLEAECLVGFIESHKDRGRGPRYIPQDVVEKLQRITKSAVAS